VSVIISCDIPAFSSLVVSKKTKFVLIYRVSINSFPDYKHLLQENYVEYRHNFLTLLKLVS